MKVVILSIILVFCFVSGYSQIGFSDTLFVNLPLVDSIEPEHNTNILKLTEADWNEFGFNSFEEYNNDFKYSVFGHILKDNYWLLLIERRFIEENIHWVCIVDKRLKLVDWLQIAYENSEGFLSIKSILNQGEIKVIERNEYLNPSQKEILYLVTGEGFSKK